MQCGIVTRGQSSAMAPVCKLATAVRGNVQSFNAVTVDMVTVGPTAR